MALRVDMAEEAWVEKTKSRLYKPSVPTFIPGWFKARCHSFAARLYHVLLTSVHTSAMLCVFSDRLFRPGLTHVSNPEGIGSRKLSI